MKLSMWMIANRLSHFAMELNIRENAPVVLRSARRVYSTNCVHVYRDGDSVVCAAEGDSIRIHNVSLAECFEIIQGIFDFYEDWSEALEQAIRRCDCQEVVELAWRVLRNPLMIMDGNNRVLGMTRQYPADSMDSEWEYLCTYGYSSMNATQQLQHSSRSMVFWRRGIQPFGAGRGNALGFGGLSYGMFCDDAFCGRITLLQKDRPLNRGDTQLLEYIGIRLEPILGHSMARDRFSNINVFHHLLLGQPYDQTDLDYQLQYQSWNREDVYSLTMVEMIPDHTPSGVERDTNMLMHVIMSQIRGCVVLKKQASLLILTNRYLAADQGMRTFFRNLCGSNPVKVSFSLPCRGVENVGLLYKQAVYAMESGRAARPEECFYDCFDFGVDYILESGSLYESLHACMPTVYRLWESGGAEQFQTLKVFLENERSVSKTSEALFTHRNTVIYRLKKIAELLKHDLDDPYVREYCRLSIQVLELYYRKHPEEA